MSRRDEFDLDDRPSLKGSLIVAAAALVVAIAAIAGVYFLLFGDSGESAAPEVVMGESVQSIIQGAGDEEVTGSGSGNSLQNGTDNSSGTVNANGSDNVGGADSVGNSPAQSEEAAKEDPQSAQNQVNTDQGAEAEISKILIAEGAAETAEQTLGIDVSVYQGNIDWKQVADAGIDFAMIRVGYRTMKTGEIVEDSTARYNLQEATANGIHAGVYFFSSAVSEAEAIEEAQWVADFVAQYKITYPVAYDCEGYENTESRQYNMTKEERTNNAKAFLNEIYDSGYTPMFYSSKGELEGDSKWMTSELEKSYKIWVSWYPAAVYPETAKADYTGSHAMWQYTNNGKVAGIDYAVDVNVAYFGYESEAEAKDDTAPEQVEANVEVGHNFTEVNETVTAKNATNLRNIPSQGEDSTVMYTLKNGETATRTGTSTSGWSRVVFNGQIYYAVSSYLTTDLTVKTPEPAQTQESSQNTEADDGIKTHFAARDENVTPKEAVNLRTLPSVTNPDSKVVIKLPYGSVVKRTGINEELGWSRVEYEGQTLYCVSSYVFVVEEVTESE